MKEQNKVENKNDTVKTNRKVTIATVIFMVLILFLAGYSIGKSITEVIIESKAEVAEPILEVKSDPKIDVTAIDNIGEYNFIVSNYKENNISEVNLRYFLEIKADVDDSIKFQLYKNNEEIKLEENCSEYMLLEKQKKQEDKYLLKIVYEKQNKPNLQDILEKVQIKVHSQQEKV